MKTCERQENFMKMTFRYYGKNDPVTLSAISQIPTVRSIVSAIYDVPAGGVWSRESIAALKKAAADHGLSFEVVESVPVPEDIHGESIVPLLKGEKPADWRKSLYYHYYEFPAVHMVKRHYGVRTDRYKLMHFYNDIDVWELYDLQEDPNELNNLYGKPGYDQITKDMMDELKRLQEQYDDPIRFAQAQK